MDVRVIGLRARPELNGSTVVALTFVLDRGRFAVETSTSERLLLKPEALDFGFPLLDYETAELRELCEGARLHAGKGAAVAAFFVAQLHIELVVGIDDNALRREQEQAVQRGMVPVVLACLRAHPQDVEVAKHGLALVTELLRVPEARAQVEEAADTLELTAALLRGTKNYAVHHNGIHLLLELYHRRQLPPPAPAQWELSAMGRNSFTRRAVEVGLLGTVVEVMRSHGADEAIQKDAALLLVCFNPRSGPKHWRDARDCGLLAHLVYLATAFAPTEPTEADSVMAIAPLAVDPHSNVHRVALALISAYTHLADPEHITMPHMDAAEARLAHEQVTSEEGVEVTAQLLEQAHFAMMRHDCNFGGGSEGVLSTSRIHQSFDEWNRRLEHGDANALRYLLAGVPALAEWTAEGVDVRGEWQQMAGTVLVGILGLDT